MTTVGLALLALLFGAPAWMMTVDLVRAVRTGVATFRIGRWSGPWERPISKLTSPLAFWSAVIWSGLWLLAFSIFLFAIAARTIHQFL